MRQLTDAINHLIERLGVFLDDLGLMGDTAVIQAGRTRGALESIGTAVPRNGTAMSYLTGTPLDPARPPSRPNPNADGLSVTVVYNQPVMANDPSSLDAFAEFTADALTKAMRARGIITSEAA